MNEVVGNNSEARMIRPVEHREVKIPEEDAREGRDSVSKHLRKTIKQFLMQMRDETGNHRGRMYKIQCRGELGE